MKNKLFFTLVIALMSICATATESRLHPVLKYKTINGEKQNYEKSPLLVVYLDETGKYDSVQQVAKGSVAPQARAQGLDVNLIPDEEWDGVFERGVEQSYITDEVTFAAGDMVIFSVDDQKNAVEIKGRANYPHEKLLVFDLEKVCPSVKGHYQIVICSAMCGNPMYPKNTLPYITDLSNDTDEPAGKDPQTTADTDTDEDGSASAQATATVHIYPESAPMQTWQDYSSGYQTSYGGYQTSRGPYPTTGYASQCYDYRPSCYGGGYRFGVGLAFGFLPVPIVNYFGGGCGANYNPPPIQNIYNDNSTHYTDNSYYNYVHTTTVVYPRPTTGGPVDPPNGDGPTAIGGPVGTGNRGIRSNFDPLHSNDGKGGRFANETAMVSPRQKGETGNSIVSNPRVSTPEVTTPRKDNVTFNPVASTRSNPAQVRTPEVPRGNVGKPRTENVTAFNGADVSPRNVGRPTKTVPRGDVFSQNVRGNTISVQPKRNDSRNSGVNQNNTVRQHPQAQPKNVQPARTTQQLRNNPQVRPTQQRVQPTQRQQYQAPRQQYARQNPVRPAQTYRAPVNSGRPTAMNSSRSRH